ncbi:hypothetical protein BDZ97DRAFT_310301 [Flammula alnicola]|nr:hypothetical protein BDZ97DRAFT_310301 [Flammula alnicola]
MPFPQLPPELLWAILSHLAAEDDYLSLCACALTCRALVSPAQAGIFRTISLHSEDPIWLAKLESLPHIRAFAKRLYLREIDNRWTRCSEVLHRTLDLLSPYIVSLDIFHRRCRQVKPRFDFPSLSRLKFIEEISLKEDDVKGQPGVIHGNNALPTFLNQFPNLRAITFDECWVRNQIIDSKSDITAPVFRLERLEVRCCLDTLALDWLIPALSSLQRLHFSCWIFDPAVRWRT